MRFSVKILLDCKDAVIPSDYRRNFMALFKEALSDNPLKETLYAGNVVKPFTFAVLFKPHSKQPEKGRIAISGTGIDLKFSSSDPMILMNMYNGILSHKEYRIFSQYENSFKHFFLEKNIQIEDDVVVFKTLSPILARKIAQGRKPEFLPMNHPEFSTILSQSVSSMARKLENIDTPPESINIEPIKAESNITKHIGGEIGNKGIFKISAPKEIQQLIYDAGIGAKRSQGFGMVEVVG